MRARALVPLLLATALTLPVGAADHPRSEAGRTLAFDHRTGNEWWVEVVVTGASADQLAGVDARDTGGDWRALTLRSWGAWAGSFHVEPGNLVQFRARFADGGAMLSCEFTHPAGVERCGADPQPGALSATFRPRPGNAWWVETYVTAGEPLAKVQARANGGAWNDLTLRSWGAWAKSFHVPDGSLVQFQAVSTTGRSALSGEYRWPDATPVTQGNETPWPREGSHVRLDATNTDGSPVGASGHDVTVTYRYQGGGWTRTCEGVRFSQYPGLGREAEAYRAVSADAPPLAPKGARVGQVVHGVPYLEGCSQGTLDNVTVRAEESRVVYRDGKPLEVRVLVGEWESVPSYAILRWEAATGILLDWHECGAPSSGCDHGRYENSDAPMPGTPRSESGLARHGAFASYAVNWTFDDPYSTDAEWYQLTVTHRYEYGAWEVTCDGRAAWVSHDGHSTGRYWEKGMMPPILLPTGVSSGQTVQARYPAPCYPWDMAVVAKGQFPEDTTRNGAAFRARAWWADEPDAVDAAGHDRDAWWDARVGLLLRWEQDETTEYGHWTGRGKLTDTSLPLTAW